MVFAQLVGWRGKGLGIRNVKKTSAQEIRGDHGPSENGKAAFDALAEDDHKSTQPKKTRDLDPTVLDVPREGEGIQVEIRRDSKTVVGWIKWHAKAKVGL